MNKKTAIWMMLLMLLIFVPAGSSQDKTQPKKAGKPASTSPAEENKKTNIQAYIELLQSDVRQQKAEIMGSVIQLSAPDAAKFWPIYSEYDAELTKLNDQRLANIREYARTYAQMTDEKADELIQKGMSYQKQRAELLASYYGRVKQELGGITAARFVQVEHQLLSIIDLRIASELPIVAAGS
jgi:flagellar biosynthesis/type III secretory pathway protein FliH